MIVVETVPTNTKAVKHTEISDKASFRIITKGIMVIFASIKCKVLTILHNNNIHAMTYFVQLWQFVMVDGFIVHIYFPL